MKRTLALFLTLCMALSMFSFPAFAAEADVAVPVSYTHLDVYKRQAQAPGKGDPAAAGPGVQLCRDRAAVRHQ